MKSQYKPILILSAYQISETQANNDKNHLLLGTSFKAAGVAFRYCTGVYKGAKEPSFMIENNPDNLEVAIKIAQQFDQESILQMDNEGRAQLIFLRPRAKEILGFIRVSSIKPEGDYTYVNDTQEYVTFK
jgi:hypothetical protein